MALGSAAEPLVFNRDIRPILSDNCFACHGPDANKRKAGLRLDREDTATQPLDSGATAIVSGQPDQSELIRRITSADEDEVMPPPESGKTLSAAQIEHLRKWVAQGAAWQDHWAYLPLAEVEVPAQLKGSFVRNDIDRLLLERIRQQGLEPSARADRRTLIRRLSFDLTGLPPTPQEVREFVRDKAPGAYEALVDRLLTSPAYGERMAMYWLDLVRYADTCGYHGDQHVDVALYRDYVIRAFNDNMPFDQFTIEQLAGDLLHEPTTDQKIASGYNRLLMTTEEGGSQPREYQAKYLADRVRNVSTAWMGATMGCAECHDHKFDPFTTRDFYSMGAFFADIQEKAVGRQDPTKVPTPENSARLAELQTLIQPLNEELDTQTPALDNAQSDWEQAQWHWTVLAFEEARSTNGTFLDLRNDDSIRAAGPNPETESFILSLTTSLKGITAFRLEVLPDPDLPNDGPGRYDNGNFVLSEFEVRAGDAKTELGRALATFSQEKFPVANAVDGKPDTGWAIHDKHGQPNHAVFELKEPIGDGAPFRLSISLHHLNGERHALGRFRLHATTTAWPEEEDGPQPPPVEIATILDTPPNRRGEEEEKKLSAHYRGFAPLLDPVRKEKNRLQEQIDTINKEMPRTLMTVVGDPREVRILPRGNWLSNDGDIVTPATPAFLPRPEIGDRRATRLDLAHWLVSEENPLVARVMVNRLWKMMFGRGIATPLDDLGSQGKPPTQSELLDYLAGELIDSGWDLKHLMKLIAMSGAYRQTSGVSAALREADPFNDLFARQGRYRLDAEMVRDNALAVSALLAPRAGGPSVKPYQPKGYWDHLNFPKRTYEPSEGDDLYRRSVYTYWCRTFLHPSLAAFDAPTREECTAERVRSNTPQQALVLMNDPIYLEPARVLAELVIRQGGPPRRGINYAFQKVLQRRPTPEERQLLLDLFQEHLRQYRDDPKAAQALLEEGQWPLLHDIDRPDMAAWTSVTRVLLNLHETIARE